MSGTDVQREEKKKRCPFPSSLQRNKNVVLSFTPWLRNDNVTKKMECLTLTTSTLAAIPKDIGLANN